ncbi:MAG: hypothetical protein R3C28_15865 [Pirellulaceae bacterium]
MLRTAVIACIFGSITWQTGSAESFPYMAYVKDAVGIVRSGPGEKFYETDELPAGSAVEIYKHRDGQWCAIRPPQSSFSLVQAKDVAVTDNPQVLRVISSNAITRVGSNESDAHNVAYVKLHQGELLSVLDKIILTNNSDESQLWYKVAPPSGEFRWIHKDFDSKQTCKYRSHNHSASTSSGCDGDFATDESEFHSLGKWHGYF